MILYGESSRSSMFSILQNRKERYGSFEMLTRISLSFRYFLFNIFLNFFENFGTEIVYNIIEIIKHKHYENI